MFAALFVGAHSSKTTKGGAILPTRAAWGGGVPDGVRAAAEQEARRTGSSLRLHSKVRARAHSLFGAYFYYWCKLTLTASATCLTPELNPVLSALCFQPMKVYRDALLTTHFAPTCNGVGRYSEGTDGETSNVPPPMPKPNVLVPAPAKSALPVGS